MSKPQEAPFVIPISITELIHTLINSGLARGYFIIDSLTINPLTSLTYTIPVADTYVAAPIEFHPAPDPDHVLSMLITVDGKPFAVDPDMVAGVYSVPINFLKSYSFLMFAKEEIKVQFTNLSTTSTAKVNFRFAWAEIREKDKDAIQKKYFEVIKKWLL